MDTYFTGGTVSHSAQSSTYYGIFFTEATPYGTSKFTIGGSAQNHWNYSSNDSMGIHIGGLTSLAGTGNSLGVFLDQNWGGSAHVNIGSQSTENLLVGEGNHHHQANCQTYQRLNFRTNYKPL